MDATQVHAVLGALAAAGCPCWISGGWGVDVMDLRRLHGLIAAPGR